MQPRLPPQSHQPPRPIALGASIAAVGEALALGEALGLGRALLLNMLEGSQLGPAVRAKRANIESGHYPPNFKLRHAAKDLRLVIGRRRLSTATLRSPPQPEPG